MGNAITNISSIINQRNGISGLVSGLDTDALVKATLKYDQLRVDKVYQKKEKLSYVSDAIRAVNSQLRAITDNFSSALKNTQNMLSENTYKAKKITYKGDESAVSIIPGPKSITGDYEITVQQLATKESLTSGARLSDGGNEKTMGQIRIGQSIEDIAKVMNDKDAIKAVPDSFRFTFTKRYEEKGKEKFKDYTFEFNKDTSLENIMSTVNAADCGVKMAYSQIDDKLTITSTETVQKELASGLMERDHAAENIKYTDTDGFLKAFGISGPSVDGQDAIYTLNGKEYHSASNSFSIDDMAVTLKKVSVPDPDGKDPDKIVSTRFTVSNDPDKVIDTIKKFVEEYNKVMEAITTQLNEKPYKGYDPLTDEARAAMTDTQQKQWDERAKTGLLYRNKELTDMMSSMRSLLSTKMPSGYTLQELGFANKVTYGSDSRLQNNAGQIELDETRLREMLNKNPDAVFKTFAGNSAIADKPFKFKATGPADDDNTNPGAGAIGRIFGCVKNYLSDSTYTILQQNTKNIGKWETDIDALIDKMSAKSEALYKKYSAMEASLSRLQNQTSALANMGQG